MLRLRVDKLLEEQGKTRYSLHKELGMSWQNTCKMVNNETVSIHFDKLEAMCIYFHCEPKDLFEFDFSKTGE